MLYIKRAKTLLLYDDVKCIKHYKYFFELLEMVTVEV